MSYVDHLLTLTVVFRCLNADVSYHYGNTRISYLITICLFRRTLIHQSYVNIANVSKQLKRVFVACWLTNDWHLNRNSEGIIVRMTDDILKTCNAPPPHILHLGRRVSWRIYRNISNDNKYLQFREINHAVYACFASWLIWFIQHMW